MGLGSVEYGLVVAGAVWALETGGETRIERRMAVFCKRGIGSSPIGRQAGFPSLIALSLPIVDSRQS